MRRLLSPPSGHTRRSVLGGSSIRIHALVPGTKRRVSGGSAFWQNEQNESPLKKHGNSSTSSHPSGTAWSGPVTGGGARTLRTIDDRCCVGVAARQIVRCPLRPSRALPYQTNVHSEVRLASFPACCPTSGSSNQAAALFRQPGRALDLAGHQGRRRHDTSRRPRSEEHTSELQSHLNLVCRLLLEKKNQIS